MKRQLVSLIVLLSTSFCSTSSDLEFFARSFTGGNAEISHQTIATSDSGFLMVGETNTFGKGGKDAWVIKLDRNGSLLWQKSYGGPGDDVANQAIQQNDGSYVVVGKTTSFGAGGADAWILRINSNGEILSQKSLGGPNTDEANSVVKTIDGGFAIAGTSDSFGSGGKDVWIVRFDPNGSLSSQKAYGGAQDDTAVSIKQNSAGIFYVVANSKSLANPGEGRVWTFAVNLAGDFIWQKRFGGTSGSSRDLTYNLEILDNDTFAVAASSDTYVSGAEPLDGILLAYDSSGSNLNTKQYNGRSTGPLTAISKQANLILVAGMLSGASAFLIPESGTSPTWSQSYSVILSDINSAILKDQSAILAGNRKTQDGFAFAFVKTKSNGELPKTNNQTDTIVDNFNSPLTLRITDDGAGFDSIASLTASPATAIMADTSVTAETTTAAETRTSN